MLVNITDDEILENIESFNFTLESTFELDTNITLDPVDGVVEINDNDGIFSVCARVLYIIVKLQMLRLVWRRHSTWWQRVLVLWKCVL